MERLGLLLLAGSFACSTGSALAPYDTVPSPYISGPDVGGMNHQGVELYNARRFKEASDVFARALAYVPDPRYFFNLCLARTETGDLEGACLACVEVPTRAKAEQRDRLADEARRQLARIDALATERQTRLTCDPKSAGAR